MLGLGEQFYWAVAICQSLLFVVFQSTPLHLACKKGHLGSVELLLQHGADATLRQEPSHFNCLDAAIEAGQE